jgi:branched-chain amino acid aminotransferase
MSLLPYDDRDGLIWFNGAFLPWREAQVHVISHGLHYGSAVFEGERMYQGKIFKLEDHTERLFKSAEYLGMDIPYSADEINDACIEVCALNGLGEGYIRPIAWRGSEQMGISAQATKTHLAIAAWEWPSYFPPEIREKGIALKTTHWKKPAPDTAPCFSKASGLYMVNTIAKHEAEAEGYQDILMHCYRGYVAESSGANIFMVKDGKISTPIADCFLNGITRATVIDLAKVGGYTMQETHIMPAELLDADEVFITGTAVEVTPIGRIDDTVFTVGPITRALMDAYKGLTHAHVADKELILV